MRITIKRIVAGLLVCLVAAMAAPVLLSALGDGPASPPPEIQWSKILGAGGLDEGRSVQPTADGGYIIAGYTESFGSNVYLIKTDSSGNLAWQKNFGGIYVDGGYSVQATADGGYIVVGYTQSFGAGYSDVYLIKTDSSGNLLWSQTFGGVGVDIGRSVQQTPDGGYIIAGYTDSNDTVNVDVYLIKTNASGNMTWSNTFGGATADYGYSVQPTADGGYIIAGSTTSFGTVNGDVYLIKTDASGNLVWQKTFGWTGVDWGYSVQPTADGGYIITGITSSFGAGGGDVYLIKTDASGNLLWSKTFGGTNWDYGYSVQPTADGGYIIAGYTLSFGAGGGDVYLIKTDASGNLLWSKTLGGIGEDWGWSVQRTADGGYIIAGYIYSFNAGAWSRNVYLIKLAAAPAVTTDYATSITSTSVRLNGTLSSLGSAASANVSFQWTINSGNYTSANETAPELMLTSGNFSADLDSLSANTTYYFRAKAVGNGTTYGSEMTFSTQAAAPEVLLTVYETIVVSDSPVVLPPVMLTVNEGITVIDTSVVLPPVILTVNEGITVIDTPQILPPVSLVVYEDVSVTDSPTVPSLVTVTTNSADNITVTSARLNGNLDFLGTALTANVSFQWRLSDNYTYETTAVSMSATGPFSDVLTGLSANTTYYFRAKGVGDGMSYGVERSFTTRLSLPGDANADSVINALDITKVVRIILLLDIETPGADANLDGVVNVLDLTKIVRIILMLD